MPFSPHARGCPAPQKPERPVLAWPLGTAQGSVAWPPTRPLRRSPGWFWAVFLSPLPSPLFAPYLWGLWSRCVRVSSKQQVHKFRGVSGCGVGHSPTKGLGAGWRAAMAGWGLLGLLGAAPGPRGPAGKGVGPETCVLLLIQLSREGSRPLHRLPWTQPGEVGEACAARGPSLLCSSLPASASRLIPSPLLIMRKPGDPAKGSPSLHLGVGGEQAAIPHPSPREENC